MTDISIWIIREMVLRGEKPVPVALCPPQLVHGLTWDRTWACAVKVWE